MSKIIILTLALYLFFEILCHGFALFAGKIFKHAVVQDARKPLHLKFVQDTFYRTMLIISIMLMSHFYSEMTFFEQRNWIRFTWSTIIILLILLLLWWLNAWIIRQVILKHPVQRSVTQVFKQKISYIMLHPIEFKQFYMTSDYLKKSEWINRILSVIALIILFLDVQILFQIKT